MARFYLTVLPLFAAAFAFSQDLSQVRFSDGAKLSSFSFVTDQQIVIRISEDGKLLEYGTDPGPGRFNYYSGKLRPYLGRVDYYGPEYDSVLRGKVKSIGTCMLSYYGSSDMESKAGKLKSIGRVALDYFSGFESPANKGKLRSAGFVLFDYYSSSENEAYGGKLKSLGNTPITYYSSFEDKLIKGKVKSIGMVNYTWYTSNDNRGGIKTGQYIENINGVTYILR
jgi:hypothetical protein